MQLTSAQEELIRGFLRECGVTVRHLPPAARDQVLGQLRQGLRSEIQAAFQGGGLSEERLSGIFERLQVSASGWQASTEPAAESVRTVPRATQPRVEPVDESDGILLGVCDYWGERWGWEPVQLRILLCALGALTGPAAVLVYLGGYAEWRSRKKRGGVKWREPLRRFGEVALASGVLFVTAKLSLAGMQWIYASVFQKPLLLSEWGLLESGQGAMAAGVVLMLGPLAALGGMPVKGTWGNRIRSGVQIGLGGYGVLVAVQIAYALTGFLLRVVDRLAV
jgi:hypothetical protein